MMFVENGVDLILGTHPHAIEPIGWSARVEPIGRPDATERFRNVPDTILMESL